MSDGANRTVLLVLSLLLIAAGVVGLLLSTGVLGAEAPSALYARLTDAVLARPPLSWSLLIAVAALLAVLGLWWALRQLVVRRAGDGLGDVTLEATERGRTTVEAAAVADAVTADLRRLPGVTDGSARLVGQPDRLALRARVDTVADADLDDVRSAVRGVTERAQRALQTDRLPTHLRLRPVAAEASRVR